jgi:hypothetical protein
MFSYTSHQGYPEGSTNYDYDIFEKLPDGSIVWIACICGMGNAEKWLRELGSKSNNDFFALNHKDGTAPAIPPGKSRATTG